MKKHLTILLLLCSFQALHAQFVYTQYFDGKDTTLDKSLIFHILNDSISTWQVACPQKRLFTMAATTPNAILTDSVSFYPPNDSSVFELTLASSTWYGILALQWMQKLDFDDTDDGGIIEYSIDNGLNWQNVFNNPYVYNFYGFDAQNVDTFKDRRYA